MTKYVKTYLQGQCPECGGMYPLQRGTGELIRHGDGCGFASHFQPVYITTVRLTRQQLANERRRELQEMNRQLSDVMRTALGRR